MHRMQGNSCTGAEQASYQAGSREEEEGDADEDGSLLELGGHWSAGCQLSAGGSNKGQHGQSACKKIPFSGAQLGSKFTLGDACKRESISELR